MNMRTCKDCGKTKQESDFYGTSKGGLATSCKDCAEALLRECLTPGLNEISLCSRMRDRITAHLSENSRG